MSENGANSPKSLTGQGMCHRKTFRLCGKFWRERVILRGGKEGISTIEKRRKAVLTIRKGVEERDTASERGDIVRKGNVCRRNRKAAKLSGSAAFHRSTRPIVNCHTICPHTRAHGPTAFAICNSSIFLYNDERLIPSDFAVSSLFPPFRASAC